MSAGSITNIVVMPAAGGSDDPAGRAADDAALSAYMAMSLRITERSEAQTRTLGSLLALSANAEAARAALRGAAEDAGAAVDERMHREATSAPVGLRAAKLSRGDLDENDTLGAHEPGAAVAADMDVETPAVETPAVETIDVAGTAPADPEMGLDELMRVNLHAAEVIDRLGGGPGEA